VLPNPPPSSASSRRITRIVRSIGAFPPFAAL
jgi:hypothetical protein